MHKIDFIFSTFMHYVCAIAVGILLYAGSETAFTFKMILIMVILLIASWFYYVIAIKSTRRNKRFKVIELTSESEKPADIPDEVWGKMRELMQATENLEKENEDNDDDEG
jgi:hypothetical protein